MSQKEETAGLKKRIRELEKEIALLKKGSVTFPPDAVTVKVPDQIKPLFDQARQTVGEYFSHLKMDPTKGTIEIRNERYVLVRASALSHDFLKTIQHLYADKGEKEALAIGKDFLFDIARVIGKNDAKKFHTEMHLTDPIARLAAGPVHFAYSGWAFVDILPESKPSPDENYYLVYNHPYSFEADSWLQSKQKSAAPVCVMNAGYSSGWCEVSFGLPLTAVEITCRAQGHKHCTFIMAPPHKIEEHIQQYKLHSPLLHNKKLHYDIPTFFERKKMEQQLALYALIVENTEDAIFTLNLDGKITTWNNGASNLYGYSEKEIIGQPIATLVPPELLKEEKTLIAEIKKGKSVAQFETVRVRKNGERFPISLTVSAIKDAKGRIIGISKIGHDITKRKVAEKALKDLNNSLETLVQERTADLQRAYDDLETKVTFRNLNLEKTNRANLAKIEELEKKLAALSAKK